MTEERRGQKGKITEYRIGNDNAAELRGG